jgi:hypothetical protein
LPLYLPGLACGPVSPGWPLPVAPSRAGAGRGPGRLTIAQGGNGRGAQAADAVGQLAIGLALTGRWQSGLPHDAFRHVPAHGPWNGMTLLRDHAR